MKKISLLLCCLALLLCLTSCGNNAEPKASTPTQPAVTNTPVATQAPTDAPAATAAPAVTEAPTQEPAPVVTEAPALPETFVIGETGLSMTLPAGWTLMSPADGVTLGMYGDATFSTLLQLNQMPVSIGILREQTASIVAAGDGKDLTDTTLAGRTAYLYSAPDDSMQHAYISLGDNETLGLLFIVTDTTQFGTAEMTEIIQSIR